ncbi:MAG: acetyl-CoA C-acyltransferase [Acidobacteria bacterium]|nr:MAG: acetyl-CoA C-acyltransferase [Acidobacteriota bacterium]
MPREVFVVHAKRTPIGKFGGSFKDVPAVDLGIAATQAVLKEAGVKPEEVEEVIFGHARLAGNGPNPARQVGYRAGIPETVAAYTVNKACGSGLKAIILGAQAIQLGQADCILVGGMENMSRVPYLLDQARFDGYRLGHGKLVDAMYKDGLHCPISDMIMGETAEKLAEIHSISRKEQDEYALNCQQKAGRAIQEGRFKDEMAPVAVKMKKETVLIEKDEHPRPDTTIEALAKLAPVFKEGGSVTAGNSSGMTDGASALLLVSSSFLEKHSARPLARIVDYANAGVAPDIMGIAPVPATEKLLKKMNKSLKDFALIELNEAFAAQVLAVDRLMPMDHSILNVNGGAIALGHPIGCTGARITTTLLHELKKRSAGKKLLGLATLCISGGLGLSVAFESIS